MLIFSGTLIVIAAGVVGLRHGIAIAVALAALGLAMVVFAVAP